MSGASKRRTVSRPAARNRPRPVAFAPAPRWLSALAGFELEHGAAWTVGPAVRIRASCPGRADLLLEWVAREGEPAACYVVTPQPGGSVDRTPAPLSRLTPDERAEAAAFAARVRWVSNIERTGASEHYAPSARQLRVAQACAELARIRRVDDAREIAWGAEKRAEPAMAGIDAYLAAVSGRWAEVFADAERPAWMAPLLAALSGDLDAVRALAAQRPWRGVGAIANILGTTFELVGCYDAAAEAYAEGVRFVLGSARADLCLGLARLSRARGAEEDAVSWARRAVLTGAGRDDLLRRAVGELVCAGALDDAYAALQERCAREPFDPECALALAELLLWAGRSAEARPWLERAAEATTQDARAAVCMGALLMLEQRWPEAVDVLTQADERHPRDMQITALLAEVHLRMGNYEQARHFMTQSRGRHQNAIHIILVAALEGRRHAELTALCERLGVREPHAAGASAIARLELLSIFGGNRSQTLTRRRAGADGLGIELVRLPRSDSVLSARDASAEALRRLGAVPLSTVEQQLAKLAQTYRGSPHPLCYFGELQLWLGQYERAIELFDEALSRAVARWGFVGKAAALILMGAYVEADAQIEQCARKFAPVPGATTHVYVGEAHRRRGEHAKAIEHLQIAVEVKPGRAGAWMNLTLAHLALGHKEEAARIFHMLTSRWPRLYWDAWFAYSGRKEWPIPDTDVPGLFEKTLEMMRGNRSSHLITYFDRDGAFRIAQDVERWRAELAAHTPYLAMELRSRLLLGAASDAGDRRP